MRFKLDSYIDAKECICVTLESSKEVSALHLDLMAYMPAVSLTRVFSASTGAVSVAFLYHKEQRYHTTEEFINIVGSLLLVQGKRDAPVLYVNEEGHGWAIDLKSEDKPYSCVTNVPTVMIREAKQAVHTGGHPWILDDTMDIYYYAVPIGDKSDV